MFTISEGDPLDYIRRGAFGTWQVSHVPPSEEGQVKRGGWTTPCEGLCYHTPNPYWGRVPAQVFADYCSLTPGDAVFFFAERRVYGVGALVAPEPWAGGAFAAFWNYPEAWNPRPSDPQVEDALYTGNRWKHVRAVVHFCPQPFFFVEGLDMDEILSSRFASEMRGLRTWQGKSFLLLSRRETSILIELLLRRFLDRSGRKNEVDTVHIDSKTVVLKSATKIRGWRGGQGLSGGPQVRPLEVARLLPTACGLNGSKAAELDINGTIVGSPRNKEAWIHALMVEALKDPSFPKPNILVQPDVNGVFPEFPASPPKPENYDRIDILCFRSHVDEFEASTVRYIVIEVKSKPFPYSERGPPSNRVLTQLMGYVDFVAREMADGDYGAVSAYLVAPDFSPAFLAGLHRISGGPWTKHPPSGEVRPKLAELITRYYVLDPHRSDNATSVWTDLHAIKYRWSSEEGRLVLSIPMAD